MKILFLVKATSEYGDSILPSKSGLRNSARFVIDAINQFAGVEASLEFCIDGNSIDKFLYKIKPQICIIEAIWVTPAKLRELIGLYPHIRFVVRIHSKTPFLAMEGNAIEWIREYAKEAIVSFNSVDTSSDFAQIGIQNTYLPNIYPNIRYVGCSEIEKRRTFYRIGCFGAVRPLKNQLAQAMAAIMFAESHRASVHFYINSTRVEQRGDSVLKNIRALFSGTRHKLIEIDWLDHSDFIQLIAKMDACMQVSFTETFNIVTADCIAAHVPVVVSKEINWLNCRKANPTSESHIAEVLDYVIKRKVELVEDNIQDLATYNHTAILTWFRFINRD
jgi:hypothetical protein